MYIQKTNNSNQIFNYYLNYNLFTNVHYLQSTDLNETCETDVLAVLKQRRITFFNFMIYEQESKLTEIRRSNILVNSITS
jgi:hypothetical protein